MIKSIDIGSEALFDNAISSSALVTQINNVRAQVGQYGIKVGTSEMQYGFFERLGDGSANVLKALDDVHSR